MVSVGCSGLLNCHFYSEIELIMRQTLVMLAHVVHVGSGPCPLSLQMYRFTWAMETLELEDMMVIV